ncbi:GIY-YIG nuclease family protein [Streptomyces lavendulae]|uniref:GIY-YIG nuclease family protein n=1 Tax=Streptomyces lavendulae TaxID=1914 RepID=UPI0031EBF18C
MTAAPAERTALYRLFDSTDRLLYVGITDNPRKRFGEHAATKEWWPSVAERQVEWHATRLDAEASEREAIQRERPKWNIRHAPWTPPTGAEELYAEYSAALKQERMLLDEIREQAARDLKAGATVSQLAKLTGLTSEYFRRIARAEGVERLRPPTVGRLQKEGGPE